MKNEINPLIRMLYKCPPLFRVCKYSFWNEKK